MLEEVFCYAPSLGRTVYFLVPTSRMQNFGYVNLQPSDVVPGGGGTPMDFLVAQLNGTAPMASSAHIKNPCLKSTIDLVLHNTDILNQMSDMLRKFGFKTGVQIIFEESSNLIGDNGKKRLGQFSKRNDDTYIIKFDTSVLPSYSQELIVSTIYHEVLHAQMTYLFGSTAEKDHEMMISDKYFNIATYSLLNQFPRLNSMQAQALIFSGLKDTKYYNDPTKISELVKNIYNSIESDFKNHKNGTYCN